LSQFQRRVSCNYLDISNDHNKNNININKTESQKKQKMLSTSECSWGSQKKEEKKTMGMARSGD
jgi:hypothetical protein